MSDFIVLGREIFASADGETICWRGVNYVKQDALVAAAERADTAEAEADKWRTRWQELPGDAEEAVQAIKRLKAKLAQVGDWHHRAEMGWADEKARAEAAAERETTLQTEVARLRRALERVRADLATQGATAEGLPGVLPQTLYGLSAALAVGVAAEETKEPDDCPRCGGGGIEPGATWRCALCRGSGLHASSGCGRPGTRRQTMSDRTVDYLRERMEFRREYTGLVGVSSDALVIYAVGGEKPDKYEFPRDRADWRRCLLAYARAPQPLRDRMRPVMREYRTALDARHRQMGRWQFPKTAHLARRVSGASQAASQGDTPT